VAWKLELFNAESLNELSMPTDDYTLIEILREESAAIDGRKKVISRS
jgi:hypothetical protein